MENIEVWKDVCDFEGLYQVSNKGRVRRIKILAPYIGKTNYLQVNLTKNESGNTKNIHRLVALAFIPNPENKPVVNHKDGNKENNSVENLQWASYSENSLHSFHVLGNRNAPTDRTGRHHPKSRRIAQVKEETGEIVNIFFGRGEAAKAGFTKEMVTRCCNGKAKRHKGYLWKYIG